MTGFSIIGLPYMIKHLHKERNWQTIIKPLVEALKSGKLNLEDLPKKESKGSQGITRQPSFDAYPEVKMNLFKRVWRLVVVTQRFRKAESNRLRLLALAGAVSFIWMVDTLM